MNISNKSFITNIVLFVIYTVISIITYIVVGDFLHIFLVWNLFLAAIPFGLIYLLDKKFIKSKIAVVIILLLWLFFFPNSVYIITDLIYVDISEFVGISGIYEPTNYLQALSPYLALFHIYLGAFIGLLYGMKSIFALYDMSKETKYNKYKDTIVIAVFFLSGIAIYVGRFFRYNSWEILKVYNIVKDLINDFSGFMIFFILGMTVMQCIIFYSIKFNFSNKKTLKDS